MCKHHLNEFYCFSPRDIYCNNYVQGEPYVKTKLRKCIKA